MADSETSPDTLATKTFVITIVCVVLYVTAVFTYGMHGTATTGVSDEDAARAKQAEEAFNAQ